MLNDDQEIQRFDEDVFRIFEDNVEFQNRLEDLQEIVPDRPPYNPNRASTAFQRAIRRQPLVVPPPPTDVRLVSTRSTGKQTKLMEYFHWSRKFPDLFIELILEIASHLEPLTLLHFSRTSKLFRKTLMNKASRWVWQGALHTVLGLPACPDDLNEALYTALVFDRYCFSCGVPDAYSVDYALRLRLCKSCWDANVVDAENLDQIPAEVSAFLLMLIPSANTFNFKDTKRSLTRVNPQMHIYQDLFHGPELRALFNFFSMSKPSRLTAVDLTKMRTSFLDRAQDVVQRQMLAVELYAWERIVGAEGIPDLSLTKATEDHHFISVGFSLEWHMNPYWNDIVDDEDFDEIPDLSADTIAQGVALNSDPPKSKAQIALEHRSRADRESATYDALLETRYDELAEWYELLLDDNGHNIQPYELPTSYDGARLFAALATRDDARAPIDHTTVGEYSADVLTRARAYTFDVRCALADLVPPFCGPHQVEDSDRESFVENMLERSVAFFLCSFPRCRGNSGYQWDQLTAHWRDVHACETVWHTPPPLSGRLLLNRTRKIRTEFWAEGAELADRILDVAGLARGTTMNELDYLCLAGRLYCACGDPDLLTPGDELCWSLLVCHVHDHLEMDKCRRPRNGLPWINDHRNLDSCIKLLPEGADTSAASIRVVGDPHTTARIKSFLQTCPEGATLVCSLCAAMIDDPRKAANPNVGPFLDTHLLSPVESYIVYHMQAKHGIEFDEKNVTFQQDRPPQKKVQVDLRRFFREA